MSVFKFASFAFLGGLTAVLSLFQGGSIMNAKNNPNPLPAMSAPVEEGLEGYVGERVNANADSWLLHAREDNPNILEAIGAGISGTVSLKGMINDYYSVSSLYNYSLYTLQSGEKGVKGNSANSFAWSALKDPSSCGDLDIIFKNTPGAVSDWSGAKTIAFRVYASQFGAAPSLRLNFEETDETYNTRKSWKPTGSSTGFLVSDASGAKEAATLDSEGYLVLPQGFVGWVGYDLATFTRYWTSGNATATMDLKDCHQYMMSVRGGAAAKGTTIYFDSFSILGSVSGSLPSWGGSDTLRQVWDLDRLSAGNAYTGSVVPWYGEFVGKLLEGLTYNYELSSREDIKAEAKKIVESLAAMQKDDGYLGTYTGDARYAYKADNWDLWNHFHIINGLLEYYQATSDSQALSVADKAGEGILASFTSHGGVSMGGGNTMNLAIGTAFLRLYKITSKAEYLTMGRNFIDHLWATLGGNWLTNALAGKEFYQSNQPRWEALHSLEGLGALYEATGESRYLEGLENIWWSIETNDVHNDGGFSTGEQATGDPFAHGVVETCCSVSWMALSSEYLRLSRDPYVADELERGYFNAILGSLLENNKYCTYNTPMNGFKGGGFDGRRVASQQDIAFQYNSGSPDFNCCQANIGRGLNEPAKWALLSENDGVYLNYYGASRLKGKTPSGQSFTLTQETDYPVSGAIKITLEGLTKEEEFPLNLRIPSWSHANLLSINGEKQTGLSHGSYFAAKRLWKAGDKVELTLSMAPHFLIGEKGQANYASVFHGPILVSMDQKFTGAAKLNRAHPFEADRWGEMSCKKAFESGRWLDFEIKDSEGTLYSLCDFASAGHYLDASTPGSYYSWLTLPEGPEAIPNVPSQPSWDNAMSYAVSGKDAILPSSVGRPGEEIRFQVASKDGYALRGVHVYEGETEISLRRDGEDYLFVMPFGDVAVQVDYAKAYTVRSSCLNCTLKQAAASVYAGDKVSFSLEIPEGYALDSLKIQDEQGGEVIFTNDGDSYAFTQPEGDVTVLAVAKKIMEPNADNGNKTAVIAAYSVGGVSLAFGGAMLGLYLKGKKKSK